MKTSRIMQWVFLGLIVFGLGAGLAMWKQKGSVETAGVEVSREIPASMEKAKEGLPAIPEMTKTAALQPGMIVPEAPPMPGTEAQEVLAAAPTSDTALSQPVGQVFSMASAVEDGVVEEAVKPVAGATATGGAFALVDQSGAVVTEQSWPGKFKLVFFGFTRCPDICPAALQKMAAVMETLADKGAAVQPLFITTDPENDTPEVMNTYIGGYDGFAGLTGTKEQVDAVIGTYKVYSSGPDHSAFIYLMSPDDAALEIIPSKIAAEEMVEKIAPHLP